MSPEPYYSEAGIQIFLGDCRDVLSGISDGVACTVTSPPYNTLGSRIPSKPTGGFGSQRLGGWVSNVRRDGYADDMDEPDYILWQTTIAGLIRSVSVPGASFFYNHKQRSRESAVVHPLHITERFDGWNLRQEIVWDRGGAIAFNARMFAPCDERIVWLVRDDASHKWNQPSAVHLSIWRMAPPVDVSGHPCPYPIELPQRCIAATTDAGDVVLDPFSGAGTTLVAAKNLGRRAIGIEIEERYCEIAARRLDQGVLDFGVGLVPSGEPL